jgi:serine/threonine-protein kinase RsbT
LEAFSAALVRSHPVEHGSAGMGLRREIVDEEGGKDAGASREQQSAETWLHRVTEIPVQSEEDIVVARQEGRKFTSELGFNATESTHVVTAISELARNIFLYAGAGEIVLTGVFEGPKRGVAVLARDDGPGIDDIRQAMQDGYSTSRGLGLGLGGARRLMDEFELTSKPGEGTTVAAVKWCRPDRW